MTSEIRRMNDLKKQRKEQKKLLDMRKEQQMINQIQAIISQLLKEEYNKLQHQTNIKAEEDIKYIRRKMMETQEARVAVGVGRKKRRTKK